MKKRINLAVAAVLTLVAGCRSGEPQVQSPESAGAEVDHSQHMSGAPTARQAVQLTETQARALGVVYETVGRRDLERTVRTVGRIATSEDRVAEVTPKIDGFVERLFVATTGEPVRRGQPLLSLYSPDLVAAQEELLTAKRLVERLGPSAGEAYRSASAMLEAARRRLGYWDVSTEQIERLEGSGEVTKALVLTSPVSGIVLEKSVVAGQRVSAGALLYRVADLSEVWVEGDVFERDLQLIRTGSQAHIEVAAYPGEHLMGMVSFVYPVIDVASRTNRVRVTVRNPDLRLKPGMFATVFFDSSVGEGVLAVPLEAVIVTGERNLVFVLDEQQMLQPRDVVLGVQAGDFVQILAGLAEGETIVAAANFLVDAESRLATSGGSMPGMQHGSVIEPDSTPPMGDHRHD